MSKNPIARSVGAILIAGSMSIALPATFADDKPAAPAKAPSAPPAPKPDAAGAVRARAAVESYKKQADQHAEKAGRSAGKSKEAAEAASTSFRNAATAYEALAKAFESGVATDIKAANEAAGKAEQAARRAADKSGCMDQVARYSAPLNEGMVKNTPEAAKPALDALSAANKRAAEAWEKVAATITPEAEANAVEAMRDSAVGAGLDTTVAMRAFQAASSQASLKASADKTGNPDAAKKLEELKGQDDAILATMRQQNELALKLRKMERDRNAGQGEFNNLNKPAPKAK